MTDDSLVWMELPQNLKVVSEFNEYCKENKFDIPLADLKKWAIGVALENAQCLFSLKTLSAFRSHKNFSFLTFLYDQTPSK